MITEPAETDDIQANKKASRTKSKEWAPGKTEETIEKASSRSSAPKIKQADSDKSGKSVSETKRPSDQKKSAPNKNGRSKEPLNHTFSSVPENDTTGLISEEARSYDEKPVQTGSQNKNESDSVSRENKSSFRPAKWQDDTSKGIKNFRKTSGVIRVGDSSKRERTDSRKTAVNEFMNSGTESFSSESLSAQPSSVSEEAVLRFPYSEEKGEDSPGAGPSVPENPDEKTEDKTEEVQAAFCEGVLDVRPEGYGFLRAENFYPGPKDVFVAPPMIKRFQLKTGDYLVGNAKPQAKGHNVTTALCFVDTVNGIKADRLGPRPHFDSLVPAYPDSQLKLETSREKLSTRLVDLIAPIGKGQRGLIVSPPKAGKTVLLKEIANSITENYPDVELIVLLIDERPEEVTDIRESVKATVISSTFDEMTSRHIAVSELCLEHAHSMVECGKDVVILMDSITRLARAYNMEITPTGRSLSGGLDPGALYKPKKFFGSARNIKYGGSLTIIATALVDTGSRLDDVIYEEFKGTGNMELHLDRSLAERRIFPAINVLKSGTRKEELLLDSTTLSKVYSLRKALASMKDTGESTEALLKQISKYKDNADFVNHIRVVEDKGNN